MAVSEWSLPARATTHLSSVPQGAAVGTWALTGTATGVVRGISEWSAPVSATTPASSGEGFASGMLHLAGASAGSKPAKGAAVGGLAYTGRVKVRRRRCRPYRALMVAVDRAVDVLRAFRDLVRRPLARPER